MAPFTAANASEDLLADVLILRGVAAHLLALAIPEKAQRDNALDEIKKIIQPKVEDRASSLMSRPDGKSAAEWKDRVELRLKLFGEL
jgi:hypothetical protein